MIFNGTLGNVYDLVSSSVLGKGRSSGSSSAHAAEANSESEGKERSRTNGLCLFSQFKVVITEVLLADFFLALVVDRILQFLLGSAKLKVPS